MGATFVPKRRNGSPRRYIKGYRTDDFLCDQFDKQINAIRANDIISLTIYPQPKHESGMRKTMAVSLPWCFRGACELKPDDNDLASIIDGSKHRIGGRTPPIDRRELRRFAFFVRLWIHANLKPLAIDTDISIEKWIEESSYPEARKKELLEVFKDAETGQLKPMFKILESFIKDEFYQEPKAYRTINSRHDYFKCVLGPWVHAVEKEVFMHPDFIKKIPVPDRAAAIMSKYIEGMFISTRDFTAWEASMKPALIKVCEIQLFKYMLRDVPASNLFIVVYSKIMNHNVLRFAGMVCVILSRRMSGEMSTSIGNGFTNLMLIRYIAWVYNIHVEVYVEGDDSIVFSSAPLPEDILTRLGFVVKTEIHRHIYEARFCNLAFDSKMNLVRDPVHTILRLGWSKQQYINTKESKLKLLLRLKAISLKCEMPNCPVLGPLADRLLYLTRDSHSDIFKSKVFESLDLYHREELKTSASRVDWKQPAQITLESRFIVEELFGISVEQQLQIEKRIPNMQLSEWDCPELYESVPKDNKMYWDLLTTLDPRPQFGDVAIDCQRQYKYQSFIPNNPLDDDRHGIPVY